ncbi:DNA gyrase C-terminal beta-propeller domain-containing protein, partial [Chromobacterium piscinae]
VVTISHTGYIKAQPIDDYSSQRRGGRGKQAAATKDDDFIETLFVANTHDYVLCFSSRGRCYWRKVYDLPQGGRQSRGKPMVNVLPLEEGEKINALLPVKEFRDDQYVFMATADGTVKKTPLRAFSKPRAAGIIAINLDEGNYLVGVALTCGKSVAGQGDDEDEVASEDETIIEGELIEDAQSVEGDQVMLFSDAGKSVRFSESQVRPMGRTSRGVRGMKLGEGQKLISLLVTNSEDQMVLTASDGGYGKRTCVGDFRRTSRGTQGVIAMDLTDKTGFKLVAASLVEETDDIMLITTGGVLIRTKVAEVRETGRSAQGVRLINLDEGEKLIGLEIVAESEAECAEGEGDVDGDAAAEQGEA